MKIALSCDHRGQHLYHSLADLIRRAGHELVDSPTCSGPHCDYPDLAYGACQAIVEGRADRAVLLCGSGIGMCIAANKMPGIRAALVHDDIGAEVCRRHNDANVICLSADMLGQKLIERCIEIWLTTEFEGGRHARRTAKIAAIEAGLNPTQAPITPATTAS